MVKCIGCGFLAYRNQETRELEEVERSETGTVGHPYITLRWGESYATVVPKYDNPVCFARAFNLQSEYANELVDPGPYNTLETRIERVVSRTRDCNAFIDWRQGFTPKEHQEREDRETMLKRQEERDEADKKWRIAREDADRKWQARQQWLTTLTAALLGGIAGFLTALLTRGRP